MKVHYRTGNGRLTFEVEGDTTKELFAGIAELSEVFDAETACGCCDSRNILFRKRTVDNNQFFELYCQDCTATLDYGQRKDGKGLFPKRKDYGGGAMADRGWKVYKSRKYAAHSEEEGPDPDFDAQPARSTTNRS